MISISSTFAVKNCEEEEFEESRQLFFLEAYLYQLVACWLQ
jgi:hypothetical protein